MQVFPWVHLAHGADGNDLLTIIRGIFIEMVIVEAYLAAGGHYYLIETAEKCFFRPREGAASIGEGFDFRFRQIDGEGFEFPPDQVHDALQ